STLEPVIVGADATDPAAIADDALLNIDNVFVMNDGRVLCCEDADQFSRSYPNDCLYVYTPDGSDSNGAETDDADDIYQGPGDDDDGDDTDNDGDGHVDEDDEDKDDDDDNDGNNQDDDNDG